MAKFRAVQYAAKWMSPTMMADITDARRGTPILPRDIVTAMLYGRLIAPVLDDGRKLYPMAFKKDVSDALDAITQTPGDVLMRTEQGWIGSKQQGGSGIRLVADDTLAGDVAAWISPDLTGLGLLLVQGLDVGTSAGVQRGLQVSTDGGTTWLDATGDYHNVNANGELSAANGLYPQAQRSGLGRDFLALMIGISGSGPTSYFEATRNRTGRITGQSAPITHVRAVALDVGGVTGNLRNGRIIAWGL